MEGYSLSDFGSYFVGGLIHEVTHGSVQTINFTREVSYQYDPKGHFAVGHSYVQYFVPEKRNNFPPVVLVHGGGMSGASWETTPDGRPGWLHILLQGGYECHVIDLVERGRSGFAPNYFEGQPLCRTMQEAWQLFRFGGADGFETRVPFKNQKFPIEKFETFSKSFVPRWITTSALQVSALNELLEKLGTSWIICHSQGGEIALDAASISPEKVAGIVAIEPSGSPSDLTLLSGIPLVLVHGDYTEDDAFWLKRNAHWKHIIAELTAQNSPNRLVDLSQALGPGNSHFPMLDCNSHEVLDIVLQHVHQLQSDEPT